MKFTTTIGLIFTMALSSKEASAAPQGIRGSRKMMESKEKGITQSNEQQQRDLAGAVDSFCFQATNPSNSAILVKHWDDNNNEVSFLEEKIVPKASSGPTCLGVRREDAAISLTFFEGQGNVHIVRQREAGDAVFGEIVECLGAGCKQSITFYRNGNIHFELPTAAPRPARTPSPTPVPRPTRPTTQGQFFTATKWEFCFDCSHPDVVLYNEQATEDNIMVEWMNAHGQPYADRDILGGFSGQKCISKTIDSPEDESISVKLTIQGDDAVVIDHATLKKNDRVSQQFGEHGGTAYCLSKNSDDNKWFRDIGYNTVSGRCSEAISFVNGEINNLHEGK